MNSTFAIRGTRHHTTRLAWAVTALLSLAGALSGCSDGTCEPEGEFVARSPEIGVLALDEEAVYWTALTGPGPQQFGEIWRKAKAGGEPERLYQSEGHTFFPFPRIGVDATHVYWLEPCSRPGATPCAEVRRVPKAGGEAQALVRDRVYSFAVDGDRLYYTTSNEQQREGNPSAPGADGAVWSMAKDGSGQPVSLVSNLSKLRHLRLEGEYVYFIADRGEQPGSVGLKAWISRVPKTDGTVETAALSGFPPDTFALTDQGLVFFEYRTLVKVPQGDTVPAFIHMLFENEVEGLVVSGDRAYFGDSGRGESGGGLDGEGSRYICGAIRSLPLSGGEGKVFSDEQIRPHSLLSDGAMLYWVSAEPGYEFAAIRRSPL